MKHWKSIENIKFLFSTYKIFWEIAKLRGELLRLNRQRLPDIGHREYIVREITNLFSGVTGRDINGT